VLPGQVRYLTVCHGITADATCQQVTLRLMVSQSVCLGVEANLGLLTRDSPPQSFCHYPLPLQTSRPVYPGTDRIENPHFFCVWSWFDLQRISVRLWEGTLPQISKGRRGYVAPTKHDETRQQLWK
jgi:hypothetical protein